MADRFIHVARKGNKGKKHGNRQYGGRPQPVATAPVAEPKDSKGKFNFDTIHGLELKEVVYSVPSISERKSRRSAFDKIRGQFLRHLAENYSSLLEERLGLTKDQIDAMKKGKTPLGFNVHHKLPIHGGGKNEFSNFILTPLYPHDQWHHDVIDPQIKNMQGGSAKILLPWTDEMIYDPKKYGFYRDGQAVEAGYTSKVNPENACYMKNWLPEHVALRQQKTAKTAVQAIIAQKALSR